MEISTKSSKKYVSYLRVSTQRQGASGLGLEAQRDAVTRYVAAIGGAICKEFIEVESGAKRVRPVLVQSIALCRQERATLIIAKLDRLARNVSFVSSLMDGGVEFVAADAPYANRLMIHILAAFAEHERQQISERTRQALAAAKTRGVILGANGRVLAEKNRREAQEAALRLRPAVEAAIASGAETLQRIANHLNSAGHRTRESCLWTPATVHRLVARISNNCPR